MTAGKWWQLEIAKSDKLCNVQSVSDAAKQDGVRQLRTNFRYQNSYGNYNQSKSDLTEKASSYKNQNEA